MNANKHSSWTLVSESSSTITSPSRTRHEMFDTTGTVLVKGQRAVSDWKPAPPRTREAYINDLARRNFKCIDNPRDTLFELNLNDILRISYFVEPKELNFRVDRRVLWDFAHLLRAVKELEGAAKQITTRKAPMAVAERKQLRDTLAKYRSLSSALVRYEPDLHFVATPGEEDIPLTSGKNRSHLLLLVRFRRVMVASFQASEHRGGPRHLGKTHKKIYVIYRTAQKLMKAWREVHRESTADNIMRVATSDNVNQADLEQLTRNEDFPSRKAVYNLLANKLSLSPNTIGKLFLQYSRRGRGKSKRTF